MQTAANLTPLAAAFLYIPNPLHLLSPPTLLFITQRFILQKPIKTTAYEPPKACYNYLYNNENKYSEGEMSKLRASIVCETSLSIAMKNIGAHDFIRLGKGEIKTDGKHKDAIIADAFEAIVGAVYLDGGYEEAKKVIFRLLNRQIEQILSGKIINSDYKTVLQEELQKNGTVKIEYNLIKETGPEHDKSFFMEVLLNGKKIGEGYGKNKKQAEQSAAKDALNKKGWN